MYCSICCRVERKSSHRAIFFLSGHVADVGLFAVLVLGMTSSDSKERYLGAVSMLVLAVGAIAVVLAVPRTHAIVDLALVMVLMSAVVIAVMASRMVWGKGKKRQSVLTRERRKLVAAGLFAFVVIAAGALMTLMQPGNPMLALGCIVVAGQVNALFVSRAPSKAAAGNLN
jgi:hypothetical protein